MFDFEQHDFPEIKNDSIFCWNDRNIQSINVDVIEFGLLCPHCVLVYSRTLELVLLLQIRG